MPAHAHREIVSGDQIMVNEGDTQCIGWSGASLRVNTGALWRRTAGESGIRSAVQKRFIASDALPDWRRAERSSARPPRATSVGWRRGSGRTIGPCEASPAATANSARCSPADQGSRRALPRTFLSRAQGFRVRFANAVHVLLTSCPSHLPFSIMSFSLLLAGRQ
jgi:hypothetical protein